MELQAERGRQTAQPESIMTNHEPPRGPFDADEVERMDPDNWDWDNPIEGVTVGEPKLHLTLEFNSDEVQALDALVAAAHSRGLATEEFIKRVAFDAVHATRT
jgi:hypothetical protein